MFAFEHNFHMKKKKNGAYFRFISRADVLVGIQAFCIMTLSQHKLPSIYKCIYMFKTEKCGGKYQTRALYSISRQEICWIFYVICFTPH